MTRKYLLLAAAFVAAAAAAAFVAVAVQRPPEPPPAAPAYAKRLRPHFDHAPVTPAKFESPQAVTRSCLGCHPDASRFMQSSHWQWVGEEVAVPGHEGKTRIGKRNLLNNFCLVNRGNEKTCTKCHAGYGWADDSFDFTKAENVDCLVCHERTGTYVKGPYGIPTKETDLAAAARSVGTPQRENCLGCHAFGGGGQGVKHGDLDSSLAHPFEEEDVHIGRHGFLCVDCHRAPDHQIQGKAFSVSVEPSHGVACNDCHADHKHHDARVDAHVSALACQACHIPEFAGKLPTKAFWDWSKAGDPTRKEDAHTYLKIKGEFAYEQGAVPEYRWFNGHVGRYLVGDKIDPTRVTPLNPPQGGIDDRTARIWPFKIHRGKQPYDAGFDYLFPPVTGGKDGYWTTFDWDSAFKRGSEVWKLPYSGKYGFAPTEMYWPLSHMVSTKERALSCTDCHGESGRMDWKALGYAGDPIRTGGRK